MSSRPQRAVSIATKIAPKVTPKKRVREEPDSPCKRAQPERILVPLHTAPPLLPPILPFSLPDAIDHLSRHDSRFVGFYKHLPLKPYTHLEAVDPFRTLVTSIIGQQVSWLAAKAITKRFRQIWGFEKEDGFPTPLEVSKGDVTTYRGAGFSQRKAEYVIAIAEHFVSGEISTELLKDGTDEEIAKALIAVRGIGQWTVDMFLMFSLRRPDVLPVGDLGVQKGLLRWALAAHGALPPSTKKVGKKADASRAKYKKESTPLMDRTVEPVTPASKVIPGAPPTPISPEVLVKLEDVEAPTQEMLLEAPAGLDPHRAVPLEGLSIELLKSRLAGKKAKGGVYLTPKEMEGLTDGWRPYRSVGVYYMWPAGEEY